MKTLTIGSTASPVAPDFSAALRIASRLTTDALGNTVPEPRFRTELRRMQPEGSGRAGNKPALDARQKARVRQLRAGGMPLADIAKLLGTSYHRVQQVD